MEEYKYKLQGLFKTPASIAGRVCKNLSETTGGLTPKRLVDASRAKDSPLHNEFEWDDSVAGEKYREEQARQLIKNIVVVQSDSQMERRIKIEKLEQEKREAAERGFVPTGEKDSRYVTLTAALTNEQWKNNLLKQARKDSEAFVNKYHRLEELAKVIDDMKDFLSA